MAFRIFFLWYARDHPQARRLNTYISYWKWIRQLYYNSTGTAIVSGVGENISKVRTDSDVQDPAFISRQWFNGDFAQRQCLVRDIRAKHELAVDGLFGAFYYYWVYDTEAFALERDRVQLATVFLFLAYTGCRPGAIVESGCTGIRGTNKALLYGYVKLGMIQIPGQKCFLILEIC